MTALLASVCSLSETMLAREAGVDIIDLKNPRDGALGALDYSVIEELVAYVNGARPVSATIGNLPFEAKRIEPVIKRMARSGVDIIKIGVSGTLNKEAELNMLSTLCQQGIRIVLVLFAEQYDPACNFKKVSNAGITGVMLDTEDKGSGSLREKLSDSVLQGFVNDAKGHGLLSGLAGSLNEKDIASLLHINPDYLGFRGGLCQQGRREMVLDMEITKSVRRRIPAASMQILPTVAII